MSGLMKGFGKMSSMLGLGRAQAGLPPLPEGLGLPERSKTGYLNRAKGEEWGWQKNYIAERAKAENYNKAFAELLNNQPQLSGSERHEIYDVYSDKFIQRGPGITPLTNYGAKLSSAPAKKGNQAAQVPTAAPVPQTPVAKPPTGTLGAGGTVAPQAPATVGPVPQPQAQAPAQAPAAAAAGNVAGSVGTMGADASSKGRGRRGRMATLLSGLGGAVERFGG